MVRVTDEMMLVLQAVSRKMTPNDFIYNLTDLNDGKNFDPAFLRHIFNAIKSSPLECK